MLVLRISRASERFLQHVPQKELGRICSEPLPNSGTQLTGATPFPMFRKDIGEYRIIYHYDDQTLYIDFVSTRDDDELYSNLVRTKD